MKTVLFVIANLCSILATLVAIMFCLLGRANATPEAIRVLKAVTYGFLAVGVAGLVISIVMHRAGHKYGNAVALLPTLIVIVTFIVAYVKEW